MHVVTDESLVANSASDPLWLCQSNKAWDAQVWPQESRGGCSSPRSNHDAKIEDQSLWGLSHLFAGEEETKETDGSNSYVL